MSYLQSVILPSYAGGVDAGAGTVMADSGSINGVPATGSHYLLTEILRHQMHFKGVVISDYQDVQALQTAYHVAADPAEAIAEAVNAGVDMAMYVTSPDQWQLARRLRRGPRVLHGAARPDPARHHGAKGHPERGSECRLRARPGKCRCRSGLG
jgi:beta-glucosidase-like glycosyl hydrolase